MWTFVSRGEEGSPFTLCQEPAPRKRWVRALSVSSLVHVVVLVILCWPVGPVFVKPNLLAKGEGGKAAPESVALYLPKDIAAATETSPRLPLPLVHQQPKKGKRAERHNVLEQEKAEKNEIGSALGSSADGPADGDEVMPALPVSFPDPNIPRAEVPAGLQGDVIVEITIDSKGNVSETRLLQGVGHGLDEKVMAAARAWHFHPATRNGVAILSRQDYRFHFPS